MQNTLIYRISLGFTILLTLAAFVTLLGWFGALIHGAGRLPFLALLPWQPVGLVALAAINCTIRSRVILRQGSHAGLNDFYQR